MNEETNEPSDATVVRRGAAPFDLDEGGVQEGALDDEPTTETMPEAQREFLLEAVRRAPLLSRFRSDAAELTDVVDSVDMSRSTVHRAINTLEEYDVVEQSADGRYRLTGFGEVIAEETEAFSRRAWTAMSLDQFLNSISMEGNGVPVGHFADADVVRRKPRQPHATIHRIMELFESSDSLRMFSTVISPIYVDVGYREMTNGMEIEAIFDREIIDIMLSEYPEKARETIETGNFEVYAHDGLPFELFIFDDRVGMAAHNERGNAEVLVECQDVGAIEWAEELYAERLSEAEPLLASDL